MLTVAVLVSAAACLLLATSAVLTYSCKQHLARVRDEVSEQRESKARKAEKLDIALARAISEGKQTTGELIDAWQARRVEILACGKTGDAWAWDDEDLVRWAKEQVTSQTEAVKRRTLVKLALATIILAAIAGGSCAVYYSCFAPQQTVPALGASSDDLGPVAPEFFPASVPSVPAQATQAPTAGQPAPAVSVPSTQVSKPPTN